MRFRGFWGRRPLPVPRDPGEEEPTAWPPPQARERRPVRRTASDGRAGTQQVWRTPVPLFLKMRTREADAMRGRGSAAISRYRNERDAEGQAGDRLGRRGEARSPDGVARGPGSWGGGWPPPVPVCLSVCPSGRCLFAAWFLGDRMGRPHQREAEAMQSWVRNPHPRRHPRTRRTHGQPRVLGKEVLSICLFVRPSMELGGGGRWTQSAFSSPDGVVSTACVPAPAPARRVSVRGGSSAGHAGTTGGRVHSPGSGLQRGQWPCL